MQWLITVFCCLIIGTISYICGFEEGYKYAESIATGKRWVKASKDFMRGLRKGD